MCYHAGGSTFKSAEDRRGFLDALAAGRGQEWYDQNVAGDDWYFAHEKAALQNTIAVAAADAALAAAEKNIQSLGSEV